MAKAAFVDFCKHAVCGFLQNSIVYGRLELHLPDDAKLCFGQSAEAARQDQLKPWRRSDVGVVGSAGAPGVIKVDVFDEWFFVRIAMEFDLGLAR
eukprot:6976794-Prorocentrum_lima.AAC.1